MASGIKRERSPSPESGRVDFVGPCSKPSHRTSVPLVENFLTDYVSLLQKVSNQPFNPDIHNPYLFADKLFKSRTIKLGDLKFAQFYLSYDNTGLDINNCQKITDIVRKNLDVLAKLTTAHLTFYNDGTLVEKGTWILGDSRAENLEIFAVFVGILFSRILPHKQAEVLALLNPLDRAIQALNTVTPYNPSIYSSKQFFEAIRNHIQSSLVSKREDILRSLLIKFIAIRKQENNKDFLFRFAAQINYELLVPNDKFSGINAMIELGKKLFPDQRPGLFVACILWEKLKLLPPSLFPLRLPPRHHRQVCTIFLR